MKKLNGFMRLSALLLAITCAAAGTSIASGGGGGNGGGGNGGGGGVKVVEARVTGYVTAIDYDNCTITVGASYYGTGVLKVNSSTKISFDNVNCDFTAIHVGDWMEARYDYSTGTATKLAGSSVPSS